MLSTRADLRGIGDDIRRGVVSPVDLVDEALSNAVVSEPRLGAYVTLLAEHARASAVEAAREIAAGRYRGPLHGIPVALKDLFDTAGIPTTASSRVHADRIPARDSAVAARLSAAGAILVGKTETHELGYGLTTPQTRNAVDPGRVAGGSSGGSAVAVASGSALLAMGTDTGGSVRVPAALNGVVGFKPTKGLLPEAGMLPLAPTLDHPGVITRTVADARIALGALTGQEPDAEPLLSLRGLRIGLAGGAVTEHLDPEVERAVTRLGDALAAAGAHLVEVDVPLAGHVLAAQYTILAAEASAGHLSTLRTHPEDIDDPVRGLLEAGTLIPAVDYLRAREVRTHMRRRWDGLLRQVDVVLAPTVPVPALERGRHELRWPDGTVEGVDDAYVRLCAPANLTGLPAVSLPAGSTSDGLPIGAQLMGAARDDLRLLDIARAAERLDG